MIKLSTAQLWVHDQDEALDFYTKKLGMEVRSDVTLAEMGNFRWLTVGPAGQPDVAITLMAIPGPPVMDADTAEQVSNRCMPILLCHLPRRSLICHRKIASLVVFALHVGGTNCPLRPAAAKRP